MERGHTVLTGHGGAANRQLPGRIAYCVNDSLHLRHAHELVIAQLQQRHAVGSRESIGLGAPSTRFRSERGQQNELGPWIRSQSVEVCLELRNNKSWEASGCVL